MEDFVLLIAKQFGFDGDLIEPLTEGLIHQTYRVAARSGKSIILQQVNTNVFTDAERIVANYGVISDCLKTKGQTIPTMLRSTGGGFLFSDEKSTWRAFDYIDHSYTEKLPASPEIIYRAARCFAGFVHALREMDSGTLKPTIESFHSLDFRFKQFRNAIEKSDKFRLTQSADLIKKIERRVHIVAFYNSLVENRAPQRAMHHDCKLGNILFDKRTRQPICPIDLDTTMAGYFFSDVGDMIRSMSSNSGESDSAQTIDIKKESYEAIISGYKSGIKDAFTQDEERHIHHSGPIMIYMQAIRFLTDYLSNDVYYKTTYAQQNFDRAQNQITLLERLEAFLKEEYNYSLN